MCSINGVIKFNSDNNNESRHNNIKNNIKNIIINSEQRGKDSFGYSTIDIDGNIKTKKYINKPSNILNKEFYFNIDDIILINNNRAEPTTEYIKEKHDEDTQPFEYGDWIFTHNGTISNDYDLENKYNIKKINKIDSSILPVVFQHINPNNVTDISKILREDIIGSYSLIFYNKNNHNKIYCATNYKPLYLCYDNKNECMYISSMDFYIEPSNYMNIYSELKITELKPYTLIEINIETKEIKHISLYSKDFDKKQKKALIICSGGLDSTVCLSWSVNQGYESDLLHFNYECRADNKEKEAVQNIKDYYNCNLISIDIDFFKKVIKHSKLTNENETITKEGKAGAELAIEWVPARNLIFMSIALGYAEAYNYDYIILGGNLEESGAYSDNELIFLNKFNNLIPNAINLQNKVEVLTPVANLMKHEIVKLGIELNAPLHLTWSCYENEELHCGACGPCFMRKTAFEMNNIPEVIEYANSKR